jgi:DNA-directed RNA polymerase specialized sigma24 family protein
VLSDVLLRDFLEARDSGQSAKLLEGLVFQHAEPLVRRIVWRRLGASAPLQDREDTAADAMAELVARLTTLHRGESEPIANFRGYAAVTAHHGCDQYLRWRFPQRHRLRARLRYLMESSTEYALWETELGDDACGFATWKREAAIAPLDAGWHQSVGLGPAPEERTIVRAVFTQIDHPMLFNDLVDGVAHLSGLADELPASWADAETRVAAPATDAGTRIDHHRALERLWLEIQELPVPQRIALLLNLRDDGGASALVVFPAVGVASLRQIASTLELPAEELAGLWGQLPLSDLDIAARLGLQRQQVINLRKSARQRLGRRVESKTIGNMPSVSASNKQKVKS